MHFKRIPTGILFVYKLLIPVVLKIMFNYGKIKNIIYEGCLCLVM